MNTNSVIIPWRPFTSRRVSEEIYTQLRELITSGAFKPGDHLPSERAMAQQLQRSRPAVREALRRLEQGGYILTTHGASGAVVQALTTNGVEQPLRDMLQMSQITLDELNEYREINDVSIARWAALRRCDDDLAALRQCVAQAALLPDDYLRFVELDVLFHTLLARATGNRMALIVTEVLGNVEKEVLEAKMCAISIPQRRVLAGRIIVRHQEILEAVAQRNSDGAAEAMTRHTRAAGDDLRL